MLVAVLFLLGLCAALLLVAVLALRRQVRAVRMAMMPVAALRRWVTGAGESAPIVSAPSLRGDMLTIGGSSRDSRFVMLLFVEPGSALCETVTDVAADLCRRAGVRLLLVGGGAPDDYAALVRRAGLQQTDCILSEGLKDDFMIGPVPSVAMLDADGCMVARGTVHHSGHLAALLASVCPPVEEPALTLAGGEDE